MGDLYQAYLLRLKRSQEQTVWRATLENAHTGELLHFATELEMISYLLQVLGNDPPKHHPPAIDRSHPNL